MLSYQHGYHAGNFADVIKHVALTLICEYLCKKPKPLFYLETHSGSGLYDLKDSKALKTAEFQRGIAPVFEQQKQAPALMKAYFNAIHALNPDNRLRYYPGSPSLAISLLRAEDRLFFAEKHPKEFTALLTLPKQQKRVFFSHSDGLQHLKAMLPPPERRGLIFIDPSFEIKDEYKDIPRAIKAAYNRFSTGTYVLWYPIVDNRLHRQLLTGMSSVGADSLKIEFLLQPEISGGMQGSGLWIINPPYTLREEMQQVLTFFKTVFNPGKSSFSIEPSLA